MTIIADKLRAVLCNPEGKAAVFGSDADCDEIDQAIEAVERLETFSAVIRDELLLRAPTEDGHKRVPVGHMAWLNFLMAIEGRRLEPQTGQQQWGDESQEAVG